MPFDPIPPDDPVHPAGTRFCPNCCTPLTDPAECYSCGWWNKNPEEEE